MIFGSVDVEMPEHEIICQRTENFTYEIRSYGKRFAIETSHEDDATKEPFRKLAKYIGVFSAP